MQILYFGVCCFFFFLLPLISIALINKEVKKIVSKCSPRCGFARRLATSRLAMNGNLTIQSLTEGNALYGKNEFTTK